MRIPFLTTADEWVTDKLSHPGTDKDSLTQKKMYWLASVAVTFMVLILTLAYHIIFPQLRILIYYGLFLTLVFSQGVFLPLIVRQVSVWHRFIDQLLAAIATFIAILMMGGIPYSGGLIFVGLALVFFSLNMWKKHATIAIYIVYVITVILAGVLHPWLEVPPEMTVAVNISLYVINLLWISGFATVFVLNFISARVKIEKMEAQRLQELDEAKTKLYTGITHDFRTPLTVIKGMTDLIKEDPGRWLEEGSEKIKRNTGVLLNLVNQMLDLTRLEAGAMPVKMIRSDINVYISYLVQLFESYAAGKEISVICDTAENGMMIDFDPDKMLQIISNLLSNALKFTQPGGRVEVSTRLAGDSLFEIKVSDNGPGISDKYLPYIFDRFYRIDEGAAGIFPGSGLGLAFTRELVKTLGGTIKADSKEGEGTAFTILLPVTRKAPVQEIETALQMNDMNAPFIPPSACDVKSTVDEAARTGKPLLLMVEDNPDVVSYLLTLVQDDYDVLIAADGEEGVSKAGDCIPDIILSDIMMPLMDGIWMLDILKKDMRTSHIPVVLLTAKADIASRLAGLERGADAYLPKPFNKDELLVQLKALVEQRKKLRERYASIHDLEPGDEIDFSIEDKFMNRVRQLLAANLDDEKFGIDSLCRELNISRTQLYRKFNALTDRSIAEYIRSLRLYKARELLEKTGLTVSEAAYRTGFKNLSHFSKVFKEEFGKRPSDL